MRGAERKGSLKPLMLLITLAAPVIIFLFLKFFGVNHYTVPVFYSNGIPRDTSECPPLSNPYEIDPSDFQFTFKGDNDTEIFNRKLTVIDIDIKPDMPLGKAGYPITRISDHFRGDNKVQFYLIRPVPDSNEQKQFLERDRFKYVYGSVNDISEFARCGLILLDFPGQVDSGTRRLVLVDQKGRIRGYYQLAVFDEIDRMILEMKIILSEEY